MSTQTHCGIQCIVNSLYFSKYDYGWPDSTRPSLQGIFCKMYIISTFGAKCHWQIFSPHCRISILKKMQWPISLFFSAYNCSRHIPLQFFSICMILERFYFLPGHNSKARIKLPFIKKKCRQTHGHIYLDIKFYFVDYMPLFESCNLILDAVLPWITIKLPFSAYVQCTHSRKDEDRHWIKNPFSLRISYLGSSYNIFHPNIDNYCYSNVLVALTLLQSRQP